MDDGRVTAVTLLDLSAAFDTIDHTILLRRLGNWFGVSGKALDWFKSYLTGRSRQTIKLGNLCPPHLISLLEFPRGQFLVLCFLLSIPLHLVAWSPDMLSLIISMLTIASCMFPFHQTILLQLWMVYNHAWLLSQSWMSTNKLKLNPDKTEFLLIGNERQRSKYLSMFPIELLGIETYPAKSARNLGVIFDKKTSTSAPIYLQSAVHVFTTSGIYDVFAVTLIWIVQNCLRML